MNKLPQPDLSIFDTGTNSVERCGVIVRCKDMSTYIVEVPNRSITPKHHFVIWKKDVKSLTVKPNDIVIGIVHTHPFRSMRTASQHDIDSIPDGLVGMVYHPSSGSIVWYTCKGIVQEQLKRRK